MVPSLTDIERELAHEHDMLHEGMVVYATRMRELKEKGLGSKTDSGKSLIVKVINPLAELISEFLVESEAKPCRKASCVRYLQAVKPELAAFLAARVVIDGIATPLPWVKTALNIGTALEDEVRLKAFQKLNPRLYGKVQESIDTHPMGYVVERRRQMLVHSMIKFSVEWERWSEADRVLLGTKLMELMIQSTGWFARELRASGRKRETAFLSPLPGTLSKIMEFDDRAALMHPSSQPTIIPPVAWTSFREGGYYLAELRRDLVKTRNHGYRTEFDLGNVQTVYDGVNAIQSTPWRINAEMLTLVNEIESSQIVVKGLPSINGIPKPAKPRNASREQLAKWKMDAAEGWRKNRGNESKRAQAEKVISLARKYVDRPAIYFPTQCDFRGRVYPMPLYLNPQGSDLAKSLLTFATGKPLGKSGIKWLKIHLANTYGEDKVTYADRVKWAEENAKKIEATANDPTSDRWWTTADKPWQFLAACIEWVGCITGGGEMYVSSLPVSVDGSNNGCQHLSALTRDETTGALVNLVPGKLPADIYAEVAKLVNVKLESDASRTGLDAITARKWIKFGVDRTVCKRPVMILPYGGTNQATYKYLLDAFHTLVNDGKKKDPDHDRIKSAVGYLSRAVMSEMRQLLVKPVEVMQWLAAISKQVSESGQPITWTTPSGFIVQQAYPELKSRRIKARVGGQVIRMSLMEENPRKLDLVRQARAISPNFIHSLDASALILTVVACRRLGIESFAAVHDSYGTHAADMDTLQICLREEFVKMYQTDVLGRFQGELQAMVSEPLPPRPADGTLDITGVLTSPFFFA
jgi:DNA-directed RNA polymerase